MPCPWGPPHAASSSRRRRSAPRVAITGNADLAPALQDMPFKVVTGGRDALSDGAALAAAYQAAFPRARVEVYAESGHSPFAEEAARFDAGLEAFVSATAGRPRAAD